MAMPLRLFFQVVSIKHNLPAELADMFSKDDVPDVRVCDLPMPLQVYAAVQASLDNDNTVSLFAWLYQMSIIQPDTTRFAPDPANLTELLTSPTCSKGDLGTTIHWAPSIDGCFRRGILECDPALAAGCRLEHAIVRDRLSVRVSGVAHPRGRRRSLCRHEQGAGKGARAAEGAADRQRCTGRRAHHVLGKTLDFVRPCLSSVYFFFLSKKLVAEKLSS